MNCERMKYDMLKDEWWSAERWYCDWLWTEWMRDYEWNDIEMNYERWKIEHIVQYHIYLRVEINIAIFKLNWSDHHEN